MYWLSTPMWVMPAWMASTALSCDPGPPIVLSAASGWIGTVCVVSHQSSCVISSGPVS